LFACKTTVTLRGFMKNESQSTITNENLENQSKELNRINQDSEKSLVELKPENTEISQEYQPNPTKEIILDALPTEKGNIPIKSVPYDPSEDREKARKYLAYGITVLIGILNISLLLALIFSSISDANQKTAITIITGLNTLAASVITFYFSNSNK
jgi:hypothetical protein